MDQTNQLKKKFLITMFIVVAIVFTAGYYSGAVAEKTKAVEARAALVKEIFDPILSVGNVSGTILEITPDKKALALDVPNVFRVSLPAEYRRKNITLVPETNLVLFEQKTAGVPAGGGHPIPPVETKINPGDLKVGDQVSVIFAPESGKTFFDNELTAVHISVSR